MKYNVGYLFSESFGYHSLNPESMESDLTVEEDHVKSEKDRRLLLNVTNVMGYVPGVGWFVGAVRLVNAIIYFNTQSAQEYYKGQIVRAFMEMIPPLGFALIIADIMVTTSMSRFGY